MANRATEPLFELTSYARRGPGGRDHLSPGEIAQVARTVRRSPEVMVKVLSHGGQDLKAVGRHLQYLRMRENGEIPIETDEGTRLAGPGTSRELLEDWDLDLERPQASPQISGRGRASQKLVHKLIFSMPARTPADKVLSAARNFAREEFALKHRYAMVLHTDEPHPHVHLVLKAVSERGVRLHIRKATLREWRRGFARHLRELGVAANATERAVRGVTQRPKLDGIYRPAHDASGKRYSTHMRDRAETIAAELRSGGIRVEAGKARLLSTRHEVEHGWRAVGDILRGQGQQELADQVARFVEQMPPPRTEKEQIAEQLLRHARVRPHPERPTTRG
jgi:hypothetical protein